eukprot:14664869-Ditylum_brightwellii.AAC.1
MTSKEIIQWMESKNILKHWILPEQGLNKGTSNCNQDIHCAVLEHVDLTPPIKKIDKRKKSVDSPKYQDDAYMRLWDPALQVCHSMGWQAGVTSSKCIINDMTRVYEYTIMKRFQTRGCVVAGCGTHRGRRDNGIKTMGRWGGHQERKIWENKFIHPDAES